MAFRIAKGGLLRDQRYLFRNQKDTFYNTLNISVLYIAAHTKHYKRFFRIKRQKYLIGFIICMI